MASNPLPKPAAAPVLPLSGGLSLETEASRGGPLPFPIGDTPGRPYIRPHRLAQLTRDDEAYNALRVARREPEPVRPRANAFDIACLLMAAVVVSLFAAAFVSAWGQM